MKEMPVGRDDPISRGPLDELVGYHLRRAQVAVFQDFARAVDGTDVTPGLFGVLEIIAANPGLTQTELGAAVGIERSTVVGVIDRLAGRGLVSRQPSPTDRRSNRLELSPAGAGLLAEVRQRVAAHEARIAAGMSKAERVALIALLRRLRRNALADDGTP
jgi:DNA-binding MarR family transcriptional regulator